MVNYPHKPYDIQHSINGLIGQFEDNLKVFANRLEEKEQYTHPDPYRWEQKQKIRTAIATLKEIRNELGCLDWI